MGVAERLDTNDICYDMLPVSYNGSQMFVTPRNLILSRVAKQVDCNTLTPALYWIEDTWVPAHPSRVPHIEPKTMPLGLESDWTYVRITDLTKIGAYTYEMIKTMISRFITPMEMSAVTDGLSQNFVDPGQHVVGGSPTNWFHGVHVESLGEMMIGGYYQFVNAVGPTGGAIFLIYAGWSLVLAVLGSAFNCIAVKQLAGLGKALVAGLCGNLMPFLVASEVSKLRKDQKGDEDKAEKVMLQAPPEPEDWEDRMRARMERV